MGFKNGGYATVWGKEDKGNYTLVDISTSKKIKDSDKYETDFKSKFVRFIGHAHNKAKSLCEKDRIKITSCEVTTPYNKETKKGYVNFLVYDFENVDFNNSTDNDPAFGENPQLDDEMPF